MSAPPPNPGVPSKAGALRPNPQPSGWTVKVNGHDARQPWRGLVIALMLLVLLAAITFEVVGAVVVVGWLR